MTSRYPPVLLPDSDYARALQAHCLALDGAWEDYPWGDVVFKVGAKMFAATGASLPVRVTVKATKDDAAVLAGLPIVAPARYIGRHGWVTITVAEPLRSTSPATSSSPATRSSRRPRAGSVARIEAVIAVTIAACK